MRFVADENVEASVVEWLRREGYDVRYVSDSQRGAKDPDVLRRATREGRILITNDKDFAQLAFLQRQASAGIVLLRLPTFRSARKAKRLAEVLHVQGPRMRSSMTVIEEVALRRRALPRSPSQARSRRTTVR